MTFVQITQTDFGVVAVVLVILALLVYRIFRREPFDRVVRFGIFIERTRYEPPAEPGQPASERKTETWQWPSPKKD